MKSAPITLAKLTSKRTWKVILSWVLYIAIIGCAVFGAIAVINAVDSDNRTVVATWARGSLDNDGKYVESNESIYTKNAFKCKGLDITLDFDSDITYQVFFYNEDGDLLQNGGVTEELTGHFEAENVPEDAFYARVVVTPINDDTVTLLEVAEYSAKITISVAK